MKSANRVNLLLPVGFALILAAFSPWSMKSTTGKALPQQSQRGPSSDPCWFLTLRDKSIPYEVIEKRQNREIYGYATEIPLVEAIRVFNEETKCKPPYAGYPPLTEDEVIAAIVAGADYGKQGKIWRAQSDALWEIASQKTMPRGSLLVVESGGRRQESRLRPNGTIVAKGIRITLVLGIDKFHGLKKTPRPEQTLVIRKTYSKVETVK